MADDREFTLEAFTIRPAVRSDAPAILSLIRGLAEYEHLLDECVATTDFLEKWLFDEKKAEVLMGLADGAPVAFALFFTSFSTFLGKPGLYLEDLFVKPFARGKGFGKRILAHLANLVVERGYGRLEWACLDWNDPSIKFYLSLDAKPLNEWTIYRLTGDALNRLAALAGGE
ncbi:MAG: GNAT family N-acetyltransferase [Planctomycetota bacterium]|nr:GNAT family N-acetyltransferase [Planctomycetota bacterium]